RQRPQFPLRRFRQSHDPRSRPSPLQLLRQHHHASRRHASRTHRPRGLRHLFLLPTPALRRRFFFLLVLRKLSLHRHLHGRRAHGLLAPRRLRNQRLAAPLRPLEPSPLRPKNRPPLPLSRLARHARHPCLARLPRLPQRPTPPQAPRSLDVVQGESPSPLWSAAPWRRFSVAPTPAIQPQVPSRHLHHPVRIPRLPFSLLTLFVPRKLKSSCESEVSPTRNWTVVRFRLKYVITLIVPPRGTSFSQVFPLLARRTESSPTGSNTGP